jgi:hypothetical protein
VCRMWDAGLRCGAKLSSKTQSIQRVMAVEWSLQSIGQLHESDKAARWTFNA